MVVCKYFLNGSCRFGDKCKFEHHGPKPFGGGGTGYANLTDRGSSKNVCQFFLQGNCRYGNNCKFSHSAGGSGQSFGGQSGFGQTRSTSGFGASNRNTFNRNQNRFGALSNESTMGGRNTVFGSGNQQQSSNEAMLQNPSQVTQIQQIVRRDMETWETSKQWLLSCYTYLKEEPCLSGLIDFSPEEIRKEAYDAKTNNKASVYEQGLKSLLEKSKQRRLELKNINMHQLQSEIKSSVTNHSTESGMSIQSDTQSGSAFGGASSFSQSGALFGNANNASLGGSNVFGSSTVQQLFGSTSSPPVEMGSASSQPTGMSLSTSLFGSKNSSLFGTAGATSSATGNTVFGTTATSSATGNTLFGSTATSSATGNTLFGSTATSTNTNQFGASTTITPTETTQQKPFGNPANLANSAASTAVPYSCSEEDIAAFKADRFELGKIPDCPPPPELCT